MDPWIKEKLEQMESHVGDIKVTLALNTSTLQEHQRRSLANEMAVEQIRQELKPIAIHVAVVGAMAKVVGLVGTIVAIAVGLMKLMGHG